MRTTIISMIALIWLTSASATEIITVDFEELSSYPDAPIVSKGYNFMAGVRATLRMVTAVPM
jgi:hypothetical protein